MDLNGDGKIDILSGSYSRHDQDMAGLFQVLWGTGGGAFQPAEVLNGTDGKPLIITADKKRVTDKICTRPTAVDLDGDGKLDIVSGNFSGSFELFAGEGEGRFAPSNTTLLSGGSPVRVQAGHSDPFFVDWDGDGDLDLISGSSAGGVFLFRNNGSVKEPRFGKPTELLAARGHHPEELQMGDAHLHGPQADTRVWVDDVNGDGKLDLLIGDAVTLSYPAEGLDEATARAKFAEWQKEEQELLASRIPSKDGKMSDAENQKFQTDYQALRKKRETIIKSDRTGFVWVMFQKQRST